MTRVLTVDGNSLAHRAFHATPPAERTGAFVTGGLVRMLASTWPEGPFDGVVIGLDDPEHNRRKERFPAYKANREDKDPALARALGALPDHLDDCGLPVVTAAGAEADDLLAAAAAETAARDWDCAVLTSDRDLMALVSEAVTLLRPRSSMARLQAYGPQDVLAEFGVRPDQYVDYAALRGDPSDGLDGVSGIGPKTAARLLRDYGSVAGVYAAVSSLPPKLEAALRRDRDKVERNRRLMVPLEGLDADIGAALDRGLELDRTVRGLEELGLDRTAAAFRRAVTDPPRPPLPPPPEAAPPQQTDETPPVGASAPMPQRPGPPPAPELVEQASLF